ncbi:MAG: aspartate kinase [Candidatus Bathyarchaeota archaeon]|nr:MAG: aspartate kinase [Candidatus Bathyarchaeota archaeon]
MKPSNVKNCKRIVVKYGGASLADHERMLRAVSAVAKEVAKGTQIAVVVSAMGKTTDLLLNAAKNASSGKVEKGELDDILAMGERTSIRIVTAALKAKGVESRYFDPLDPDWPIVTDGNFSNANPIEKQCRKRIQQYVLPLVEKGVTPVIAGFVGRTPDGKITTIGRGGSDATAFILAKALGADEIVLVTDAQGIMSADPKVIQNPETVREIDVNTLVGLADSDTKFIHRKALRYKDSSVNARVISHVHGDLNADGTLITGGSSSELDVVVVSQSPAVSITVVGRGVSEKPKVIQELTEVIKAHASLLGLSVDSNSMILYVAGGGDLNALLEKVHETMLKHTETIAMSVKEQLAFLRVSGVGLEETPGIIGKISETLRLNEINIFGILTITSSILIFVDWNEREKALKLIKGSLRGDKR